MNAKHAKFHSPDELLSLAESLLSSEDSSYSRAVVLEAITALEAYVEQVIFDLLKEKFDPLLVAWLKDRTKMDFDSRLSVLVPLATEKSFTKSSDLWSRYKAAKQIRNQVTHSGRQVSRIEAQEVLSTVYDWLSYLASTAEVDVVLLDLKRYIESGEAYKNHSGVDSVDKHMSIAERMVFDYFTNIDSVVCLKNVVMGKEDNELFEIDFILEIGNRKIAIEVKTASKNPKHLDHFFDRAIDRMRTAIYRFNFDEAVVVLLLHGEIPQKYQTMEKRANEKITILPVFLP